MKKTNRGYTQPCIRYLFYIFYINKKYRIISYFIWKKEKKIFITIFYEQNFRKKINYAKNDPKK